MNKVENEHPVGEDPISWWHRCSGSDVLLRARDWGTLQGSGGSDWGWDGKGTDASQQTRTVAETLELVTSRN